MKALLSRARGRPELAAAEKRALLAANELFRDLGDDTLAEVDAMTNLTTCPAGRVLYEPQGGDEVLFLLKKGHVQLYRLNTEGKKLTVGDVKPGSFFGEMSVLGQRMSGSFAEATQDSLVCAMSRADVSRMLRHHPDIADRVIEHLAARLRDAEVRLETLAYQRLEARLASVLLRECDPRRRRSAICPSRIWRRWWAPRGSPSPGPQSDGQGGAGGTGPPAHPSAGPRWGPGADRPVVERVIGKVPPGSLASGSADGHHRSMPLSTVPVTIDDPVNVAILSVSEDRLQGFQRDPLTEIARRSGVELPLVIERIRAMLQAGTIRRVRQTLLPTNLAHGALIAWQVPPDRLSAAFDYLFQQDPFSGHVVIRTTDAETPGSAYRLWTTLKVPQGFLMGKHAEHLAAEIGAQSYRIMPAKRLFALGVGHTRRRGLAPGAAARSPPRSSIRRLPRSATASGRRWRRSSANFARRRSNRTCGAAGPSRRG